MDKYDEISKYVKNKYGFVPKPCWIADVKEMLGLPLQKGRKFKAEKRKYPCPPEKIDIIKKAINHFYDVNKYEI